MNTTPVVIKQNTYSVLKKDRNVIEKKILAIINKVDPSNSQQVLNAIAGKRVKQKELGKGEYGLVFSGMISPKKTIAIKFAKNMKHEYRIMNLVSSKFIFVPKTFYIHESQRDILYFEFANGGTVESFLDKVFKTKKHLFNH